MPHGVDGPGVFNDEEGNPLPLVDVNEIPGADTNCERVDYKEGNIEVELVSRDLFVIGDVDEKFFEPHTLIVRRNA